MSILYDIIFILFALIYFPFILIKGKWPSGFSMRFGSFSPYILHLLKRKQNIWFHAVSVGEVLAVTGLIKKVKESFPQCQIVISTVTQTGYELAQSQLVEDEDIVIYAPLDISFIVRRYLDTIKPKVYISAETEIWPNLFIALAKRNVPIVQVNGRISEKSFYKYKKVKFLLKDVLSKVTVFCMQSLPDANRMLELGAEAKKIIVTGNMKFDDVSGAASKDLRIDFRRGELVWVAGSTHPGEERIILQTFKALRKEFPQLRLILAPRHVDRVEEIYKILRSEGLSALRFSKFVGMNTDDIVLIDTIGHLRALYQLATIVFVGKSLTGRGGQNIIEPAVFAKPIMVGPHMQNFRNIMAMFQEANAVIQIKEPGELTTQMRILLQNPQQLKRVGEAAQNVVKKNQGATSKTFQILSDILAR